MKIGAITIGQSPRPDIILEIKEEMGLEVEIEERGALDGLTLEEVKDLYPKSDDYILITRMRDGKEVKIAARHLNKRILKCITDLENKSVNFIMLLCTGEFPDLKSKKPILRPDILLKNVVKGIFQKGTIALVAPSLNQISLMENKWKDANMKMIIEAISPFTGKRDEIEKIAKKISKMDVDLVVLDCLGFNKEVKNIFKKITKKPVILPRTILGKIARELIEK